MRTLPLLGAAALAVAATTVVPVSSDAAPPDATYTITVDAKKSFSPTTDTPASTYVDKDGTFYFQQAAALYGADQPREWDFYSGRDFDSFTKNPISSAVNPANPADRNDDTTWRCNNSPTGKESTDPPAGSGYSQRNFCDLVGTWVDPDTGDWYGLIHNEFTPEPFGAYSFSHYDAIDMAVSKDQGKTWTIKDHAITSPYSTKRGDTAAFPHQTFDYGDGDPRLFVDTASGYFYVYYGSRIVPKAGAGGPMTGLAHVARSPISAKMASGSWQKWFDGGWSQPGVGGRESNMVPVSAAGDTGYTPVADDYDPANTGNVTQQIAAGQLPKKSDLFIMNIAYNAHLGLYIGAPEAVDSVVPQRYYVTDDLTTQKWRLIGDTGSYTNQSWYRWFVDAANKTNSTIIGKQFRSYCAVACSNNAGGEYTTQTITSSAPAPSPVDTFRKYRIGLGDGRVLAQGTGTATTSVSATTGSDREAWQFTSDGDGSYRIANAATGQLLGVDAVQAGRAWGAKPTVTSASTVGQQWFVIPSTVDKGTFRLVNRYSGLVLGLSGKTSRLAETTPLRSWSDTTGNAVGGGRTAAEQTLKFTDAGAGTLGGVHTLAASGKNLDDPDSSTAAGTPLVTWTPNSGANQKWLFTRQSDGSYTLTNAHSKLCADVEGGATTAGARVIQWTCTGGTNQRWNATKQPNGTYKIASVRSGLLLTTASTSDGAAVTQQADTGSALQAWAIG
ncbi:RICIN domain-containing protein [Amycolatopsis keratiniphila]|uniref:RICIN domain-containing protein n=1 Tax=Amycolatopsis keratiniphila TaxID=129921 RepID=UPI0033D57287